MTGNSDSNSFVPAGSIALKPLMRGLLMAGLVSFAGGAFAQDPSIQTFPSPYMAAKDTPLKTIAKGATVNAETEAYWDLPSDSPQRTSYDANFVNKIAEGVWSLGSPNLVNMNVVQGPDGLIVMDTGDNVEDAENFYKLLRSATDAPIRAIVYSHEHYVMGAKYLVDEEARRGNKEIKIIGHPNTNSEVAKTGGVSAAHAEVGSVLFARSVEQFNFYMPLEGPDSGFKNSVVPGAGGFVPVNTPVEDGQEMKIAGLDVVFYTKGVGTDTSNQVLVWIPSRRIAMNNIIWGWYPNIYSARGGRYRDPTLWMASVDILRALKPDILLSTHSTPLADPAAINQRLQDYRDGLAYVLDQTLKGILLGQGPDELRYSVKLPERLQKSPILVQNYGEVSIMSPRIFTAVFGQFDRNAAHLHKLHPKEEAGRMVQAMGGVSATYDKAAKAHADGDYLWACQLADYVVQVDPTQKHRQLKADCLRQMGYRTTSTNTRSWMLSQALELEGKTAVIKTVPGVPASIMGNLADYVNFYRVRVNSDRSAQTDQLLALEFDEKQRYGLHVRRSLVDYVPDLAKAPRPADVTVSMKPETWVLVFNNLADPSVLIDQGDIKVIKGDKDSAKAIFALFDPIYDWKNDPALVKLGEKLKSMAESAPN